MVIGLLYKTHQDHWNSTIQKAALEYLDKFEQLDSAK